MQVWCVVVVWCIEVFVVVGCYDVNFFVFDQVFWIVFGVMECDVCVGDLVEICFQL